MKFQEKIIASEAHTSPDRTWTMVTKRLVRGKNWKLTIVGRCNEKHHVVRPMGGHACNKVKSLREYVPNVMWLRSMLLKFGTTNISLILGLPFSIQT